MIPDTIRDAFLQQADEVISLYSTLTCKARYKDLSDLPQSDVQEVIVAACATIDRIVGPHSPHGRCSAELASLTPQSKPIGDRATLLIGTVRALRRDVAKGYLATLGELVHAELFADFLETAAYLHEQDLKDPAAVIGGAALESHLRQLATKNSIPVTCASAKGERPMKADALNSELAKASVYSKLDQKNITAWLDLRNKAAHGEFGQYTAAQVDNFIRSIREFIGRYPA